ncbi:hypothetical protein MGG_17802 [Pyricularia oryzae 70-15]|uniref:Aminotransferase class V domain-containing protein n=3 Tax=Pyricularia oryzae TaxID=318829 RepID=G4NI53_PYRO7|nr:uncharacterized protein MGG_17802 [Pyricularia oryzae 70-15]EHA47913.1 hypothetical protein MGG_17802 [Pyricularia oryzae 70-15]ELQ38280.1 hypothetical protein OOU_Y34scaffold00547g11 [Pyricularia oryzae Y34]KAI7916366.1 hypothetical protein M0657_008629 [Pyricularia oryzae]KAI7922064.1 hypothetical protein M9X92_005054 [Pyricularia oryzae]
MATPLRHYGTEKPYSHPEPVTKRQFGKNVLQDFLIDPKFRNMNHGSFGVIPRPVHAARRYYQDKSEERPDVWIRYNWSQLLEGSRAAVAPLLGVDKDTIAFVPNATVGVNTVLRNLVWNDDKKDEILYFNTIYAACGKTVQYMIEISRGHVSGRSVPLEYPLTDDELVALFKKGIQDCRAAGKRPRAAVIDTVSSIPAVRLPFEALVQVCHDEGILSIVDGAQGVGMIDLKHLGTQVKPDFFITNCHKWLYTPRGCAVLHVPKHNQALMRSTLPTSWGWVPSGEGDPDFIDNFAFASTLDNSNYMAVQHAVQWIQEALGGEDAVIEYMMSLNKKGGNMVAEMLGTKVLDNAEGTLTNCAMSNVLLPLGIKGRESSAKVLVDEEDAARLGDWCQKTLASDYNTWLPVTLIKGQWWTRISAQAYLDESDYEAVGKIFLELVERIGKGDHKK